MQAGGGSPVGFLEDVGPGVDVGGHRGGRDRGLPVAADRPAQVLRPLNRRVRIACTMATTRQP